MYPHPAYGYPLLRFDSNCAATQAAWPTWPSTPLAQCRSWAQRRPCSG